MSFVFVEHGHGLAVPAAVTKALVDLVAAFMVEQAVPVAQLENVMAHSSMETLQRLQSKNDDGYGRSSEKFMLSPASSTISAYDQMLQKPESLAKKRRPVVAKVRAKSANETYVVSPDANVDQFRLCLKEVFATSSPLFVDASIRQLLSAAKLPGDSIACTTSLSSALELIASLEPENEAQAALAVHIACLHMASINVLSRLHSASERNVIAIATAASKIERTFQLALESFNRLKNGITQIVRVERVEVHAGAQAVVGYVEGAHSNSAASAHAKSVKMPIDR